MRCKKKLANKNMLVLKSKKDHALPPDGSSANKQILQKQLSKVRPANKQRIKSAIRNLNISIFKKHSDNTCKITQK